MTPVEARFAALPPIGARCVASVAIPARDEAASIERALRALIAQTDLDGTPLDPALYEIVVFANGCDDDTERIVARVARAHRSCALFVVSADRREPESQHIGTARRAVMNAATARLLAAGRDDAVVLTTDADSAVAPDWIARTRQELHDADAVGGRVLLDPSELSSLDPRARTLNGLQNRYEFALARLESLVDPVAHDPWPRHAQHFGASFAVRPAAYIRAGGVPAHDHLEDVAFYRALLRVDARVRHSMRVRVVTSPRLHARVAGGLGTFLTDLHAHARRGDTLLHEHPATTREIIEARAALRRWWRCDRAVLAPRRGPRAGGDAAAADRATVLRLFGIDDAAWHDALGRAFTFGAAFAAAQGHAFARGFAKRRPAVPIAEALASLEDQCGALRASASSPTRSTARSGAG